MKAFPLIEIEAENENLKDHPIKSLVEKSDEEMGCGFLAPNYEKPPDIPSDLFSECSDQ